MRDIIRRWHIPPVPQPANMEPSIMREIILARLREIEEQYSFKILYAAECGSRAYGTNTEKSDYDVRFIYVRKPSFYLSISENLPDIVTFPISDDLDISGWDVRKAMRHLRASNTSLLELIQSPIVYINDTDFTSTFQLLARSYFRPFDCAHHYYSWLKSSYKKYIDKEVEDLNVKKLICGVRLVLAIRWLQFGLGLVPIKFSELLQGAFNEDADQAEAEAKQAISQLVRERTSGIKHSSTASILLAKNFLLSELDRFSDRNFVKTETERCPVELLDDLFLKCIRNAWGDL